ncbi:hypothetical protein GDO78_022866 [Eleutherodactylus coqui]|uniref:Uncharacterized protein n=1 Tax=Eleutherodactylus coqui TaxID=57060 RepID=A0A8J6JRF8_ELECQ|nr:hypothetical protein GDO78_022866 [Eleutherodactylus coqui]
MDGTEMSSRMLDVTREIIYLLTGEEYTAVKTAAPIIHPHSLIRKLLELTNKMTELLTGEVPVRCHDVAVYFSMEEWEYVEGRRDVYADAMLEGLPPLGSPDGAGRKNPPERGPHPPYSQDCPEEDVSENQQGEDVTDFKVEVEEERMRGDHPWKSEVEEDVPTENPHETSEGNFMFTVNFKVEDEDIVQYSSGANLMPINVPPGLHSTDPSYNPPNHEESSPDQSQVVTTIVGQNGEKRYQCGECGKQFTRRSNMYPHIKMHTGEKSYSCPECGEGFIHKSKFYKHKRSHTGEKPYSCPECGKCFVSKSYLAEHNRVHTGDKPFTCSECGRGFRRKPNLTTHERTHTGEKPFSCSECDKCFTNKSGLVVHQRYHTGEKPYSCSECGRGFITKSKLKDHQKTHTGERSYLCAECGKTFINKSELNRHLKKHTEEKQKYSCSKCEKYFSSIPDLANHLKSHTGEKPF